MTGRDDAHARPSHPTVDELADLREGLLTGADDARVRAHVADCAECAAETAALDDVAAMLREVGAQPIAMPSSVARAIDEAISDESAVRASAPAADRGASGRPSRRRAWVRPAFGWLAGAAAAAVIVGGTGALINGPSDGNDSDTTAGAVADRGSAEGSGDGAVAAPDPQGPGPTAKPVPKHLDERTLQSYARAFAADSARPRPVDGPTGTGGDTASGYELGRACAVHGIGGLQEPVVWNGDLATLVLRRSAKRASIYTCDATPRLLYSTQY